MLRFVSFAILHPYSGPKDKGPIRARTKNRCNARSADLRFRSGFGQLFQDPVGLVFRNSLFHHPGRRVHQLLGLFKPHTRQGPDGLDDGDFPAAEYVSDRTLSLPLGPSMSDRDVDDVIAAVVRIATESRSAVDAGVDFKADAITVVSGLPRSGTSMLMKMLAAGGLEPLTDGLRSADADNPGGYYEFEKVKQLDNEAGWLAAAMGKTVKVISQLLDKLPVDKQYKIVFALRDMDEILASQRAMLKRRGRADDGVPDAEIAAVFNRHLQEVREWLAGQGHMEVLYVDYAAILQAPLVESQRIVDFLALPLDVPQMAGVVDESLYRQRKC